MSVCKAGYEFSIRFYEFRNPLGLQCGACGSGGQPACCDNIRRTENCLNEPPLSCNTTFRFLLRPFEEPVETVPTGGFHSTPLSGVNSETFDEGRENPVTITNTSAWTVSLHVSMHRYSCKPSHHK